MSLKGYTAMILCHCSVIMVTHQKTAVRLRREYLHAQGFRGIDEHAPGGDHIRL